MKRIASYILAFFVSLLMWGWLFQCHAQSPGARVGLLRKTNTDLTITAKRVWRTDVENTAIINPPAGYTATWTIYESETRDSIISGSGNITFTFEHKHQFAHYDVKIDFTNGVKTFTKYERRLITVLPPRPTTYDETIDLSSLALNAGGKTFTNVDRAGYTIRLIGSYNDRIQWIRLYTDTVDPVTGRTDYIHVVMDDAHITAEQGARVTAFDLFSNCRGIWIEGYDDDDTTPLSSINTIGLSSTRSVWIRGDNCKDIAFSGIIMNGVGTGAAAFQVSTPASVTYNIDNFDAGPIQIMDCHINNSGDEGIYINYFNDQPDGTYAHARTDSVKIFRNRIIDTGWDATQVGISNGVEIHDNYIENPGFDNTGGQNYAIILNGGCSGIVYRNTIVDARPAFFQHVGKTGDLAVWCSNVVQSNSADYWLISTVLEHTTASTVLQSYVMNNTIISPGRVWVDDAGATTTDVDSITVINNLLVNNYTISDFLVQDFGAVETTGGNSFTTLANISDLNFVDESNYNYKLTNSTPSAIFDNGVSRPSLPSFYTWVNYDIEGILYDSLTTIGAYSAYQKDL